MLAEYEEKRLEYNLALNDLNKLKKDYESKRIEMTKRKYNSIVKENENKVDDLKQKMESYFKEHQDEIAFLMLKNNLDIAGEYAFYNSDVAKDEDNKYFVNKKTKEEIIQEFSLLYDKVQKRFDNKKITSIIYNDLNKCLNLYQETILKKWATLDKKKFVEYQDIKQIKTVNNKKKVKTSADENWVFFRIMLPMILIDIICIIFMLFSGGGCSIGSSEALSAFLCSFAVVSNLVVIFLTPIVLIYVLIKVPKFISNKKKK